MDEATARQLFEQRGGLCLKEESARCSSFFVL